MLLVIKAQSLEKISWKNRRIIQNLLESSVEVKRMNVIFLCTIYAVLYLVYISLGCRGCDRMVVVLLFCNCE